MAEEKKYYIKIPDALVEVSKEIYLAYYRMERKARGVDEKDQYHGTMLYSELDTSELLAIDMFQDPDVASVEEMVVDKVMGEKLHQCLQLLPQQEHDMICTLYFDGLSERQLSERTGVPTMTIHDRKVKILRKLKILMNK